MELLSRFFSSARACDEVCDRPPAVERMEQAHRRLLMLKRARLNDRAYKHFRKTAAYGIKYCTDYYSCKRIGCDLRKKSKSDKSDRRKQLRMFSAFSTVASAGGGVRVEWARIKAAARLDAMRWAARRRSLEAKVCSPSRFASQWASSSSTSASVGQSSSFCATSSRPIRLRSLRSASAWSQARNSSTVWPCTFKYWSKLTPLACIRRLNWRCSAK